MTDDILDDFRALLPPADKDPVAPTLTLDDLAHAIDALRRLRRLRRPKIVESRYVPTGTVILMNPPELVFVTDGPMWTIRPTDEPFDPDWPVDVKLEWALRNGLAIIRGVG